jgi:hypothetical protein
MELNQHFWRVWAGNLQRWGLQDWVASALEAAGPLTLLAAQAVYIGQPFLRPFFPEDHLKALANLLEEPVQTKSFASFLREDPKSEYP